MKHLNLSETNLGGNRIGFVNEIINYLSPHMIELDVSGNMVGELKATTFQKLFNLRRLNMRNTNLTFPNTNPFETFRNLNFDLSQNNLEDVDFSTISNVLYGLVSLELSNCRIKNISVVIQYLRPSIKTLDLSQNFGNIDLSNTNLMSLDSNLFKHQPWLAI